MRYLVKARLKPGQQKSLLAAIREGSLGCGSIAGDEYIYDLQQARVGEDGIAHWVETCYCATPLDEERPYWEKYFDLLKIQDAHNRKNCRHENGTEPWACSNCDCTRRLEQRLAQTGRPFLETLEEENNALLPQNSSRCEAQNSKWKAGPCAKREVVGRAAPRAPLEAERASVSP